MGLVTLLMLVFVKVSWHYPNISAPRQPSRARGKMDINYSLGYALEIFMGHKKIFGDAVKSAPRLEWVIWPFGFF